MPVELFDERFTSVEAEHILMDANLTSRRRERRRDMLAAQILLTAYLESTGPIASRNSPPSRPEPYSWCSWPCCTPSSWAWPASDGWRMAIYGGSRS